MHRTELYAPQIDAIIEGFNPKGNPITVDMYRKLKDIYNIFSYVKPGDEDEIRRTWIEVERGPAEAFGDYEEYKQDGEVESPEEFEQLWKEYYPEESKWYKFETSKYQDEKYFFLNGKLFAIIKEEPPSSGKNTFVSDSFKLFVTWLRTKIAFEINKLRQNPKAYNSYIQQYLSHKKRFGRIKRKEFWDILGEEAIRTDINLGSEIIKKLKDFVEEMENKKTP